MKYLLAFLFLLQIQVFQAQEIRARVLNAQTKEPIAYANVILSENRGLVTNEEGWFQYHFKGETVPDSIKISSMGFDNLEVAPKDLSGGSLYLKPASIELKEVFLTNENLSAKEIIQKASEKVSENYIFDTFKRRIFLRETYSSYVRHFDMDVDKSTIEGKVGS